MTLIDDDDDDDDVMMTTISYYIGSDGAKVNLKRVNF